MHHALAFLDDEIVGEAAVGEDGLRADAAAVVGEVGGADGGDEAADGAGGGTAGEGAEEFADAGRGVAECEAPETGKQRDGERVAQGEGEAPVAVAREAENRVGAHGDFAVEVAEKMNAEEREARVRDGVNHVADE